MSTTSVSSRNREHENRTKPIARGVAPRRPLQDLGNIPLASKPGTKAKKKLKPRGDAVKKDAAKKKDDIPETEYMPKVEKTSDLDFASEFVPSSYFTDLLSSLRHTWIPSDLAEPKIHSSSLTLNRDIVPDITNSDRMKNDVVDMSDTPLDFPDFPDIPDIPD